MIDDTVPAVATRRRKSTIAKPTRRNGKKENEKERHLPGHTAGLYLRVTYRRRSETLDSVQNLVRISPLGGSFFVFSSDNHFLFFLWSERAHLCLCVVVVDVVLAPIRVD